MTAEARAQEQLAEAADCGGGRKRRIAEEEDDDDADDVNVGGGGDRRDENDAAEPMQTDNEIEPSAPVASVSPPERRGATTTAAAAVAVPAPPPSTESKVVFSPELLRAYYSRLFPFEMLVDWLSYDTSTSPSAGNGDGLLSRREFSFTIEPSPGDEIYVRYQSYSSRSDLAAAVRRRCPVKIDIGAVFNHPPANKKSLPENAFRPEQRELVFDVDLTDYDEVRSCGCSGASICPRCWAMMGMAVRVVDEGLRLDFGFKHVAWFYSGRRGVHAWVCDERARLLTDEGRSAVASYFEVPMGTEKNKAAFRLPHPLHPALARAYETLEPLFVRNILPRSGHGLLAMRERWTELLGTLPEGAEPVRARLGRRWNDLDDDSTPEEKWDELKNNLSILVGRRKTQRGGGGAGNKAAKNLSAAERIRAEQWPVKTVFKYTYPRLDINVSKMRNHLLKSPFCVHPKTGRVCVPIDADRVDEFDPFDVPTLPRLMRELDVYGREGRGGAEEGGDGSGAAAVRHDWQKTSLRGPYESFRRRFLNPLRVELRRGRRDEAEGRAALTGDF